MIKKQIQKIKDYFKKKEELKKGAEYYKILQAGGAFLNFIYADLENHKNNMNRETRRRFESQLSKTGKLNIEIVKHYADKVDQILNHIEAQRTPKKEAKNDKCSC